MAGFLRVNDTGEIQVEVRISSVTSPRKSYTQISAICYWLHKSIVFRVKGTESWCEYQGKRMIMDFGAWILQGVNKSGSHG